MQGKSEDLWVVWLTLGFILIAAVMFFGVSDQSITQIHQQVIKEQMQERLNTPFRSVRWYVSQSKLIDRASETPLGKAIKSFMSPAQKWSLGFNRREITSKPGGQNSDHRRRRDIIILEEMELKNRIHALESEKVARDYEFKYPQLNHIAATNARRWFDTSQKLHKLLPVESSGKPWLSLPLLGLLLGVFLALYPNFEGASWVTFLKAFWLLHMFVAVLDTLFKYEDLVLFQQFEGLILFFTGIYAGRLRVFTILTPAALPIFYAKIVMVLLAMKLCMVKPTFIGPALLWMFLLALIAGALTEVIGKKNLKLTPSERLMVWGDLSFGAFPGLLMAEKNSGNKSEFKNLVMMSFLFSLGIQSLLAIFEMVHFFIKSDSFWVTSLNMGGAVFISSFFKADFLKTSLGLMTVITLCQWMVFYAVNVGFKIVYLDKHWEERYDHFRQFLVTLPLFPVAMVISLLLMWTSRVGLGDMYFSIFVEHGIMDGFISPLCHWFGLYFVFSMGLLFPADWRDIVRQKFRGIVFYLLSKSVIWISSLILSLLIFNLFIQAEM